MSGNIFSIPLDTTNPEDLAALDREINRLLEESKKPNSEGISGKEQHTAGETATFSSQCDKHRGG